MGDSSEQREFERIKVCCKLEVLPPGRASHAAAAPALSVDISLGGLCANTPCPLNPDDEVEVCIDTSHAAETLGLPEILRTRARVRRVEPRQGGWQKVALVFAPAFAQSMELAFYMAYLCGLQQGDPMPALG